MIRDVRAKILSTGPWVLRASLAGLGASLLPSLSFGLGLADIQIESRLNQPLYARVEVVDVSDDEWRQVRARIAPPMLLNGGSVHPEILASLTLRAMEDSTGRHFIEVKSGEVLTEPLFDLPVEVAGQSLQVVRNYSVLLDPATSEDAPREVMAQVTGHAGTASNQYAARVDAQARAAQRHGAHRARRHSHANAAPPAQLTAVDAAKASGQEQLEGQLATLRQTLTSMQATIASQTVEIAKLTAQVAARGESPASRRPSTWVEYPVRKTEVSSENESDARSGWFGVRSAMLYWIGGAIAGVAVLACAVVSFLRWRHAKMLREIALNEAARRQSPKPAVAPTSERDLLAWQSNLRAAQSGKWKQSLEDTFDPTSAASSAGSGVSSASEETVAVTVAVEALTQDLEADLESLNASYEAEYLENTSGGTAAWRAQNEMLERDYLSDTQRLPSVVESDHQAV